MEARSAWPDVAIQLVDGLPPDFDMEVAQMLEGSGFDIPVIRRRSGPFAGIELYMPAAATLVVASAYFGGMLKKASDDHYDLLKRVAKHMWRRVSGIKMTMVGKQQPNPRFSMTYAIAGEGPDGTRFKFLVQMALTESDASQAIEAFLDFLRNLHHGTIGAADLEALLAYPVIGGTTLVTFDPQAKRIVPVNAFEK